VNRPWRITAAGPLMARLPKNPVYSTPEAARSALIVAGAPNYCVLEEADERTVYVYRNPGLVVGDLHGASALAMIERMGT